MTKVNYSQVATTVCCALILGVAASSAMAQGVAFTKIDTFGNSFVNWLKGVPLSLFFTIALIFMGIMLAVGRAVWDWSWKLIAGAFLAFGAATIVVALKATFT